MKRKSVLMKTMTLAIAIAVATAFWPTSVLLTIGEPKLPAKFDQ